MKHAYMSEVLSQADSILAARFLKRSTMESY